MSAAKKPSSSPKASAPKAKPAAKPKAAAKKPGAPPKATKKAPAAQVAIARPIAPKKATVAKKGVVKKAAGGGSVSQTSNSHNNTLTIKRITRNIVGFYMTEDVEIRRATRSGNMSSEKLKAKYAQLKAKAKSQ